MLHTGGKSNDIDDLVTVGLDTPSAVDHLIALQPSCMHTLNPAFIGRTMFGAGR
ncbi:hypothetical protein D3C75_1377350 [compost metagenome]